MKGWDGERQIGERLEDIEPKHLERYRWASKYTTGCKVLDAACGCGYGSYVLKHYGNAQSVVGIDNSYDAIDYANRHWQTPDITFKVHNLLDGLDIGKFDVIVSFETVEHINQPLTITIKNFYNALKPLGTLIMSHPINEPVITKFHYHCLISKEQMKRIFKTVGLTVASSSEQEGRFKHRFNYHLLRGVKL